MSEAAILWIFGAVISLQTAIVGAIAAALWVHVGHCRETASTLASIMTTVERIKEDIGDHESGIRRDIREHTSALFKLDARMETLERHEDDDR
jgi:hypothetical protein